jgi:hypothetical protein
LFKKGTGSNTFTVDGWKNWNIGEKSLLKHLGSKAHIAAQERYIGFKNAKAALIIILRSGVMRIFVFIRKG